MLNPKLSVAGGNLLPSLLLRGTVKIKRGQMPNLDHIQPLFGGGGKGENDAVHGCECSTKSKLRW